MVALPFDKYPNLRNQDYKRWHPFPNPDLIRIACLEFLPGNQVKESRFDRANDLRSFLAIAPSQSARRLFILESFNEQIRDLAITELDVDPHLFHRHARLAMWESSRQDAGSTPFLPSLTDPNRSWTLQYSQLMHLNLERQEFTLRSIGSERHIASTRIDGKLDGVGAISRKISFSGTRRGTEGWDAILIVDEPLRKALFGNHDHNEVARSTSPPEPWQGGYNDFIKYNTVAEAVAAASPPRTSTFDDLCFYHTHHSKHLLLTAHPVSATAFAQKLIASEYMLLLEYNRFSISHLTWKLTRRDSIEIFNSNWVERAWSDLNSWNQRILSHHRFVELAIDGLQLDRTPPVHGNSHSSNWMNTATDFTYIEAQFLALHQRAESMLNCFTGLAGMVGNRQSLHEARSVGLLTVLGMAFVPLSLIASLFSMADKYRPGASDFWVYFAVSIPFVVVVFMVALVSVYWHAIRRQIKKRPEWSGSNLFDNLK